MIIPLCFDAVGNSLEGLARFERDGRWGYIDESGAVVIAPQFTWAWNFCEGLARVQLKGEAFGINSRWGFIDKSGKIAINSDYEEVTGVADADQGFRKGLATIQVDGSKGFIDKSGQPVIKPQFSYAYHFSEGTPRFVHQTMRNGDTSTVLVTAQFVRSSSGQACSPRILLQSTEHRSADI